MLSTPPAFILSQNQTLELIGIKPISLRKSRLYLRLNFSHYLADFALWYCLYFKVIDRNFFFKFIRIFRKIISFYSIFKLRYPHLQCGALESLLIISHWLLVCQAFFKSFLDFLKFFLNFICPSGFPQTFEIFKRLPSAASLSKISQRLLVCQAFFKSFLRNFSVTFWRRKTSYLCPFKGFLKTFVSCAPCDSSTKITLIGDKSQAFRQIF